MDVRTYKEHIAFLQSKEQNRAWPEFIHFLEDSRTRKTEKKKYRDSVERFLVVDGELYKKSRKRRKKLSDEDGSVVEDLPPQKVVRADEMDDIIQQEHDAFVTRNSGRHPGQNKMHEQIGRRYYWRNFSRDVEDWMKRCPGCQREKPPTRDGRPLASSTTFTHWEMDVLGPVRKMARSENRYVILLTETVTKWAEAFPAPDTTAESLFPILKSIIGRCGVPETVSVDLDQGSVDALNQKFACIMGTVRPILFICPAQPQKGCDDRFNTGLCTMISDFVNNGRNQTWESDLQLKLLEYRTTPAEDIRHSPFELLYGLKPRVSVRDSWESDSKTETLAHQPVSLKTELR